MSVVSVGGDYDVVIEAGCSARVAEVVGDGVQRALVVHPDSMRSLGERITASLRDSGIEAYAVGVPDAEDAKTAVVAADLWSVLGRHGFTRTDVVVGVGGGTVTDLAGFVAATWLRGVPVVQVPTTLLGMVDAAVGGKTGINTAEGKNLVGSFHPPRAVLCDLDLLSTLPREDYVAGLAEIIKAGFIVDPVILDLVAEDPEAAGRPDGPHTLELVERAIRVKADVVSQDLKESSLREILNYGHTFGHAIEQVEQYRRRHGEAVAIGMVYAAELAAAAGVLGRDVVDRHREVLTSVGLPTSYEPGRWPELEAAMRRDKKNRGSMLRFVVLEEVAQPVRLEGPTDDQLRTAYAAVCA
ncbi:3-dehydroquinate synthase [Knoellia flava TL1]|uniref:3-dehydroquinate synthase n=2 Tax=Knoellia flava TaxID=913969 RepID=A0A8H9FSY9_9MICO|nr:3-dehydroquinate synthase [Knoellia flava]KGN31581.1 3-dehydroquinate synthase [Knoellia flava TL1]GGB68234.1 3-dehydroquinate synthase [Knoellia flava]